MVAMERREEREVLMQKKRLPWFAAFLPGILVAATGVGAGDLFTATLAGSEIGLALLWAAAAGAFLKWTLNEGIARWQMATDTTLLAGWMHRLGGWIQWVFMPYFFLWTFMVGGALVNACGVAGAALFPLGDMETSKIIWGIVHSLAGLGLVWFGGYKLFEKMMAASVAIMFTCVLLTAVLIGPDWGAVLRGALVPTIPPGSTTWLLGVLGGVGGTVTLLAYGYFLREIGRKGEDGLKVSRMDLGVAYALTALFGMAMIIIGSRITIEGRGTGLFLEIAGQLELVLGPAGKWMFLVGAWGAVFSSLLGVWYVTPYIFADFLALRRGLAPGEYGKLELPKTRPYRAYLIGIAIVPLVLLWFSVRQIQLAYAVMGAMFMPLLALTLLIMNNRESWVRAWFRNGRFINAVLVITLLFFTYIGIRQLGG